MQSIIEKNNTKTQRKMKQVVLNDVRNALDSVAESVCDNTGGVMTHYGGKAIEWRAEKVLLRVKAVFRRVAANDRDFLWDEIGKRIWKITKAFVILVVKLIFLAFSPWLWPEVILAWFWRILSDRFKPAIVNRVLSSIILVWRSILDFKIFGETWAQVKRQIIKYLQEILEKSDDAKITATNRIAKIVSELDLKKISHQLEALGRTPEYTKSQKEEGY